MKTLVADLIAEVGAVIMADPSTSCCSCLVVLYRRLRGVDMRQLHPIETRVPRDTSAQIDPSDLGYTKSQAPFMKNAGLSGEASANRNLEIVKIQTAETHVRVQDIQVNLPCPDAGPQLHNLQEAHALISSEEAGLEPMLSISPIPYEGSVRGVHNCVSFSSLNSEPVFRPDDNSFEKDQLAHFINQSSGRASIADIKDQLDQAFDLQRQEPQDLKFNQRPLDPFEYENKPRLPVRKATYDQFFQVFGIPKVQGRLRLKPITPDQFAKRSKALSCRPRGSNVLDELRREIAAEGEDHKLLEGSPAPET
jgi:hypothetical protein